MGITDFFSSAWDTFSHPSPDAEAPKGGVSTQTPASGTDEQSDAEKEVNEQDAVADDGERPTGHVPGTEKDERAVEEKEEEEEEEKELVDPKDALEEGEFLFLLLDEVEGSLYE
jgi:ubiquinol-cytochrome c reductase subunit 6